MKTRGSGCGGACSPSFFREEGSVGSRDVNESDSPGERLDEISAARSGNESGFLYHLDMIAANRYGLARMFASMALVFSAFAADDPGAPLGSIHKNKVTVEARIEQVDD